MLGLLQQQQSGGGVLLSPAPRTRPSRITPPLGGWGCVRMRTRISTQQLPMQCATIAAAAASAAAELDLTAAAAAAPSVAPHQHATPEQQQPQQQQQHPHAARVAKQLGIPAAAAAAMLAAAPSLAALPPGALAGRLDAARAALGGGGSAVSLARLAARRPEVLDRGGAEALRARVAALAAALDQPFQRAARVALAQPGVLALAPRVMSGRLDAAAAALNVPRARVTVLAARQPLLLLLDADALNGRLEGVAAAVGLPGGARAAAPLVAARPLLLGASPATLRLKAAALAAALGDDAPPGGVVALITADPQLLERNPAALAAQVERYRDLLGAPRLRKALSRGSTPLRLASTAASSSAPKLAALRALLGRRQAARALTARRPRLLTNSVETLKRSHRVLSVWRFDPAAKRALTRAHPALLALAPKELHGRCRWLRALMLRSAPLHAALRRVPAPVLGALLLHLPRTWARLQFLVESGGLGSVRLMEAASMPEKRFRARFPDYARWRGGCAPLPAGAATPWRAALARLVAVQEQRRRRQRTRGGGGGSSSSSSGGGNGSSSGGGSDGPLSEQQHQHHDAEQRASEPLGAAGGAADAASDDEGAPPQRVRVGLSLVSKPQRPAARGVRARGGSGPLPGAEQQQQQQQQQQDSSNDDVASRL